MIQSISKILPIPSKSNFTKTTRHENKLKKKIDKIAETSFSDQLNMMCKFN